jgi:hypothetical protein
MGTENIDWKNAGIGAAKVVLGVATVAAGATGGPAGATGVQQLGSGLDQALGGLGVGNVGLSQTGAPAPPATSPLAQASPAAPPPPSAPTQPTVTPIATAPIVVPQTPPLVPPQSQPSRLERFERDGRPLPSPAPPPAPTAEEIERANLLRSLGVARMEPRRSADSGGWTLSGQPAADWADRARHCRPGERRPDGDGARGAGQTGVRYGSHHGLKSAVAACVYAVLAAGDGGALNHRREPLARHCGQRSAASHGTWTAITR